MVVVVCCAVWFVVCVGGVCVQDFRGYVQDLGADLRRTPLRRTTKMSLFFPSPATIFILSLSLGVSSRGILVVFLKAGALKFVRLWSTTNSVFLSFFLSVVFGTQRVWFLQPGLHTTAREPKRAHFRDPAFKHTTIISRKDPQERQKERKLWREMAKKARNFGHPTLRGPALRRWPKAALA